MGTSNYFISGENYLAILAFNGYQDLTSPTKKHYKITTLFTIFIAYKFMYRSNSTTLAVVHFYMEAEIYKHVLSYVQPRCAVFHYKPCGRFVTFSFFHLTREIVYKCYTPCTEKYT